MMHRSQRTSEQYAWFLAMEHAEYRLKDPKYQHKDGDEDCASLPSNTTYLLLAAHTHRSSLMSLALYCLNLRWPGALNIG